jgi:lipoyl(octanoyl) transferase
MTLSILDTGFSSGAFNMAADEYALKNLSGSVLRFYHWRPVTISLGRFQDAAIVDTEKCRALGIEIIRRATGGKAVLHKNELSYSFAVDVAELPPKVEQSYPAVTNALCYALTKLGFEATVFTSGNEVSPKAIMCASDRMTGDVLVGGKKVAGSAQVRYKKRVLQHGSINISLDTMELVKLFSAQNDNMAESAIGPSVTSLEKVHGGKINTDLLKKLFIEGIANAFNTDWQPSHFSSREMAEIERLFAGKYRSPEWTNRK